MHGAKCKSQVHGVKCKLQLQGAKCKEPSARSKLQVHGVQVASARSQVQVCKESSNDDSLQ